MEISFCSHPNNNIVIATIFGTWHDSWAVVACAKFCRDMITSNWIKAKWNFHRIWIVMEKSLVKWVPGPQRISTLINNYYKKAVGPADFFLQKPMISHVNSFISSIYNWRHAHTCGLICWNGKKYNFLMTNNSHFSLSIRDCLPCFVPIKPTRQ